MIIRQIVSPMVLAYCLGVLLPALPPVSAGACLGLAAGVILFGV